MGDSVEGMKPVAGLCGLTFELSGRQRQDARPGLAKMYRVPPDRAWWPAVEARLSAGLGITVDYGLNAVAVWVNYEASIVVGAVVGPWAWASVVPTSVQKRLLVELMH